MPRKPATPTEPAASYSDAVHELEQLVAALESGQLPLEQLLDRYQRGMVLLRYCRDRLQAVEDQVKVLDESGAVKPWIEE